MDTCLVLIGLQNDYFPGGGMELVGVGAAAANARRLLDELKNKTIHAPEVHAAFMAALSGSSAEVRSTKTILENSG